MPKSQKNKVRSNSEKFEYEIFFIYSISICTRMLINEKLFRENNELRRGLNDLQKKKKLFQKNQLDQV